MPCPSLPKEEMQIVPVFSTLNLTKIFVGIFLFGCFFLKNSLLLFFFFDAAAVFDPWWYVLVSSSGM